MQYDVIVTVVLLLVFVPISLLPLYFDLHQERDAEITLEMQEQAQ